MPVKNSELDVLQKMLRVSSSAQLLLEGERVEAVSPAAERMLAQARAGASAEDVFGDAVEQYRQFSGNGSLLFPVTLEDLNFDVTVAPCGSCFLATLTPARPDLDTDMLRAIADSIRKPLAGILAITPTVLPMLEETMLPHAMERGAELNRSLYAILRITGNLQLCGAGADPMALRPERADLALWLQAFVQRAEPLCQAAGLTLESRLPAGHCMVLFDRDRLERALLNLLSNAIKFSEPGTCIRLHLHRRGQQLRITVQDQGCGIPADRMSTLFRHDGQRDLLPDPRQGAGLGLPIVRRIVQAHGGRLVLESEPGVGTSAHISLNTGSGAGNKILRSRVQLPDYSGGIDHMLMELSDALPASVFDPRTTDL